MTGLRQNESVFVRAAWADEVSCRLTAIQAQRKKLLAELEIEEDKLKATCNHTYPDGRSAMHRKYDGGDPYGYEGRGAYEQCEACGKTS